MLDGVYLNRDGVAVFHEAAAPTVEELEALLAKIITRTMQHIDAPGGSHRRTRGELPRRNGYQWRAAVAAGRLVHLSYCAGPTRWAESAELAKPAEQNHAVHPRAACQRARL